VRALIANRFATRGLQPERIPVEGQRIADRTNCNSQMVDLHSRFSFLVFRFSFPFASIKASHRI